MHIPDGVLDLKTSAVTAAMAAAAVGVALDRSRRSAAGTNTPLMGVGAACLFAAQMINFPIPGGTSGHLLGGVLAAVLLGPWAGIIVLTVVLLVQCLLMTDGGITALGANVFNVGVIGSLIGYTIFEPVRRLVGGPKGTVAGAVIAAWFSVVLGATACSIEVAVSQTYELPATLGIMLFTHSIIGLGEALITGFALVYILKVRPDLVYGQNNGSGRVARTGQVLVAGLATAFAAAILLSPFASQLPDGLESSLERLGLDTSSLEPLLPGLMPDYTPHGLENVRWAGSVAGAVGTLVVFAAAFLISRGLGSRPSPSQPTHAS